MAEAGLTDSVVRWRNLISTYFPVHRERDIWSYSAGDFTALPSQGWKIHVSATLLSAPAILAAVCDLLRVKTVLCKTLHDPSDLLRLNCGLQFGYSQVGKFVTVYPATEDDCVGIAGSLAEATACLPGPAVPFERRVSPDSPVFVRYGVFVGNAERVSKLQTPDGQLVEDSREANPSWAAPPPGLLGRNKEQLCGPLGTRYLAYDAIIQRGKGGVYLALDLNGEPRKCILKEGRRFGEVDGKGVDGRDRLGGEYLNLIALRARGIQVPKVYDYFNQDENSYIVLEYIKGQTLSDIMVANRSQPGVSVLARQLSIQLSELVAKIHSVGYVWRDLKAANVILATDGEMRPIDFEGSLTDGTRLQALWGSPGHVPAEWATSERAEFSHDLFALGALIRQLHAPSDAQSQLPDPLSGLKSPIREIVAKLMSHNPKDRPCAASVADALRN